MLAMVFFIFIGPLIGKGEGEGEIEIIEYEAIEEE
jgi:hypothetical protein